jgi:pimeloyl-ACP methyl ester carboxylesterase
MNRRQLLRYPVGWLGAQALAGCAFAPAEAPPSAALNAADFNRLRRHARTPRGQVAYVEHGAGPVALFLHGFPLNGFQWRGALAQLAPYRRCIAPDFLGMGWSRAAPGADLGPASQAAMLVDLLDALGVAQADLIANDSGGAVAQLLAITQPTRVRSLLLTNGDTEMESPPAAMNPVIELAREGRFVDEWLMPWLADPGLARSDQGIGGLCYADRRHPTDEALREYFGPLEDAGRKDSLQRYAVALAPNALAGTREGLRRCRIPVRIVWGMADGIFRPDNATFLDEAFGGSRGVRRLPDAKLFWPEERPATLAEQARMLWESVR